jgi:phosphatidate cytidylyltransferase
LLPALFYPSPEPFYVVAMVFIVAGSWEWARLAGYGATQSLLAGACSAAVCTLAWALGMLEWPLLWLWLLAAPVWVLGGAWLLRGGAASWRAVPRAVRLVLGVVLLCVAWLAVSKARLLGVNFLLSAMLLVWVADIGAYFAGRTWGGRWVHRKLAPGISPGKSWEGVFGGMLGVLVLSMVWRWADGYWESDVRSLYTQLAGSLRWLALPALLGLAAMSVVGDLLESLVKRVAGVKDSSALLPGHGGVLDRLDALLPTLPLALLFHAL